MCMARREQRQFLIVYRITGSKPEDDSDERFAQSHSTRKPTYPTAERSGTYSLAPTLGGLCPRRGQWPDHRRLTRPASGPHGRLCRSKRLSGGYASHLSAAHLTALAIPPETVVVAPDQAV